MDKNWNSLSGTWKVTLEDGNTYPVVIPGTLDESNIGNLYTMELESRLTRVYSYTGRACFTCQFEWNTEWEGKRLFFYAERARMLTVLINGEEVKASRPQTLSTPHEFEITGQVIKNQFNILEVISDNTYIGLPKESIEMSSAATDETQTNWNGLLGKIGIYDRDNNFISNIKVLTIQGRIHVEVILDCKKEHIGRITCKGNGILSSQSKYVSVEADRVSKIIFENIPLSKNIRFYDEYESSLYDMTVEGDNIEAYSVSYGIRSFEVSERNQFLLNHHPFLLRGEANCGLFPITGHSPMVVDVWRQIFETYRSYGVNCVRFHSWCPPEAAFSAADELGMFVQPELSQWNPKDALEQNTDYNYYKIELEQILSLYGSHPSFIMLTLGNELWANDTGHCNMTKLLQLARSIDPSRLYANGSNVHYGELGPDKDSDFYTSMGPKEAMLRGTSSYKPEREGEPSLTGHINNVIPSTEHNYINAVKSIHEKAPEPVYGFEVGQYEILPDFDEISKYTGVTRAFNLEKIKEKAAHKGLLQRWTEYVRASGELSLLCYKEEVEAVLRTGNMSGLSLLGLQDFSGQGTALVGMLNALLKRKPYGFSDPDRFRQFFHSRVVLGMFPKYTYENKETLKVKIAFTNYTKESYEGEVNVTLLDRKRKVLLEEIALGKQVIPNTGLVHIGEVSIKLNKCRINTECELIIRIGSYENSYPVWVYMTYEKESVYPYDANPDIRIVQKMDRETMQYLINGGLVFYTPPARKEYLPESIKGQFTNDFWSVGTFPYQEGGMGCLIDATHPIFKDFPTDSYSNWQWWQMTCGRPIILEHLPGDVKPVVEVMDSFCRLNRMANLMECKISKGKLMISAMGLLEKTDYPEVRALLKGIYDYMESSDFNPVYEMSVEEVINLTGVQA